MRDVVVLCAFLALGAVAVAAENHPFDPARVSWSRLSFRASKLGLTATSEVELARLPAAEAASALTAACGGPPGLAPAGDEGLLLTLHSRLLGRRSRVRLWVEPGSAAALQRERFESGKRKELKTYRFTGEGVCTLRRKPAEGEEELPAGRWSRTSERFTPYPPAIGAGSPVTEPSALLYLISASGLERPGQRLRIHAFTRDRLHEVEVVVEEATRVQVDHVERSAAGERRVRGPVEALRLSLAARPAGGGGEGDFQVLGLEGDVELYLDRATRVPLLVTGRVPVVGRVRTRLQEVELGRP